MNKQENNDFDKIKNRYIEPAEDREKVEEPEKADIPDEPAPLDEPVGEDRLSMVKELVVTTYGKLKNKELSVPDFVRLLSLEKAMAGEERVHEVRVQWVLPSDTESDS